jgi:hypothetical protein
VPVEMLSGPDLGGGFLHQLSLDLEGEGTTFTHHAQDGGSDAGGPPKGPLNVFGFVRTAAPCMFGGPRCWHRRFLLGRAEAPRVRKAYNRHRFVLETLVDQAYSAAPVPVERALPELVRRLAPPLDAEGVEWYVGGSTAAWLLGAQLRPRDIDLGTTRVGVDRIAELLSEYLIEPVAPTDWPGSGIVRGARAFVGTFREGARVEWAVPLEPGDALPLEEWSGRPDVARLATVEVEGHRLKVSRPEYALVRSVEKRNGANRAAIVDLLGRIGTDRELLEILLNRSSLTARERDNLFREAGA